jgi:hypothetical protein
VNDDERTGWGMDGFEGNWTALGDFGRESALGHCHWKDKIRERVFLCVESISWPGEMFTTGGSTRWKIHIHCKRYNLQHTYFNIYDFDSGNDSRVLDDACSWRGKRG